MDRNTRLLTTCCVTFLVLTTLEAWNAENCVNCGGLSEEKTPGEQHAGPGIVYHPHNRRHAAVQSRDSMHQERMFADPSYSSSVQGPCDRACSCARQQPRCKSGVTMQKDGCGCCYMCARQQGDLCDARYLCDTNKGLYCTGGAQNSLDICRARSARECDLFGRRLKDGEQFFHNCSQLCTCQNGHVICGSTCPHESRPPSPQHCPDARLVAIEGKCCKEWACPLQRPGPLDYYDNPGHADQPSLVPYPACDPEPSEWSACSVTCGVGESMRARRVRSDVTGACDVISERRLCLVRPCSMQDQQLHGERCHSMWPDTESRRITFDTCASTTKHLLQFCSTCKRNKCCAPASTDTVELEFTCRNGSMLTRDFMMIKTCNCHHLKACPFK